VSLLKMDLPQKTREMHNHHFDSTKWNNIPIRDDDVIVTTVYKSGTTWTQAILMKLFFQGEQLPHDLVNTIPWVDLRVPSEEITLAGLESLTWRRQMKTHLPLFALKFSTKAKYIHIGRDGRDCFMSLTNHYKCGNELLYQLLNDTPGLVGDKIPIYSETYPNENVFFDDWISKGWPTFEGETDGYPYWSFFDNIKSWWDYRHLPNILFIHFTDLLSDLEGSVREIAAFLDIPIKEDSFPELINSLRFDEMKKKAVEFVPMNGAVFEGGPQSFINKGTNGRWKGVLTNEQLDAYDKKAKEKLSPECILWLENGKQGYKIK